MRSPDDVRGILSYTARMPDSAPPTLTLDQRDHATVVADGTWQVQQLAHPETIDHIMSTLRSVPDSATVHWDLSRIAGLDHIGGQLLWNAWNKTLPQRLTLETSHKEVFKRLADAGPLAFPEQPTRSSRLGAALAMLYETIADHTYSMIALIGQLMIDLGRFATTPLRGPWKEISANVFHIGYQALGITALVGFLIGVVLSYLSAQQLHTFGGDIYLVNILGMSIIRELGPLLAAILVAGRSGSAVTAQLGVMRVTEELDAMLVMGMPHGFRLILPKVIALAVSMPLLVIWTDTLALMGGMAAAKLELGLSPIYFLRKLPEAVPLANYLIGLGKGVVFGGLIGLIACHFGLRIQPNTESLGQGTTVSVVTAITAVIVADAVFAVVFNGVGF